jgi:ferric-dicitrate binding protein FerR (iron transport regulator)
MTAPNTPKFEKIHALAVGVVEGTLPSAQLAELQELLVDDAEARRLYLEHMQESACLTWVCANESDLPAERRVSLVEGGRASTRRTKRAAAGIGLLATVLIVVFGMQFVQRRPAADQGSAVASVDASEAIDRGAIANRAIATARVGDEHEVVATVTAVSGALWGTPTAGAEVLSRWHVGDSLKLLAGSAELTFDAGAQVTVFGPAEFEITSPTSIRCLRGRITTLVDERGRGFFIETPRAKVVDLGTQFGVDISDEGETEVVVFQGSVDLSAAAGDATTRRMEQGEALLVNRLGAFERVMAVERDSFLGAGGNRYRQADGEPVIGDVRDNIRGAESAKSYQIVRGGLQDDALAFVDRSHEWNGLDGAGLPPCLAGADYIMPFNGDKFVRGLELKVTLLRAATLYVIIDNNMAVPNWLRSEFTDTGVDVGLDCSKTEWHKDHDIGMGAGRSVDFRFSVWKRDVQKADCLTLGGVEPPKRRSDGFNMYGIAAVAAAK